MGLQVAPGYIQFNVDGSPFQHPPELMRNLTKHIFRKPGVVLPGHFAMAPVPSTMNVTIQPGGIVLPGPETTDQGFYFGWSDTADTLSWPSAGGSQRVDTLIMRVLDPQYGAITGSPQIKYDIITNVGSSPVPDSAFASAGANYQPGSWIRLYDVTVPASATQLLSTNMIFRAGYANIGGQAAAYSNTANGPGVPASPALGDRVWLIDAQREVVWDGTAWQPSIGAPYVYTGNDLVTLGSGWGYNSPTPQLLVTNGGRTFQFQGQFSRTGAAITAGSTGNITDNTICTLVSGKGGLRLPTVHRVQNQVTTGFTGGSGTIITTGAILIRDLHPNSSINTGDVVELCFTWSA